MERSCIYEQKLRKTSREFWILFGVGLWLPVALLLWFRPESQPLAGWFQRGGSLMCIFGILAQMRAIDIYNILNPSALVEESFEATYAKYKKAPAFFNGASFVLTGVGTLIWGYGDLWI